MEDWLPDDFTHWRYQERIIDDHVHVSRSPSLLTFVKIASDFNVIKLGAIFKGNDLSFINSSSSMEFRLFPNLTHLLGTRRIKLDFSFKRIIKFKEKGAIGVKFWFGTPFFAGRRRIDTQPVYGLFREIGELDLIAMIHVSDPDIWHERYYSSRIYESKTEIRKQVLSIVEHCPETKFILVHMGGNPESPDSLLNSLNRHDNLYLDTSATKWVSRELSKHYDAAKRLFLKYSDRILFGSDLVIPPYNQGSLTEPEYYSSRYLVQRLMLEYDGKFESPIVDPDKDPGMLLHGLGLPGHVLKKVYYYNALGLGF